MSSRWPSRVATRRRASTHCRVRSLYACRAAPDFSACTRLDATMNCQSAGTGVGVSRSRRNTVAHREGAGREAGIAVDEARLSIPAGVELDADALAEGHGEDRQAAVVDVLANQVHAPGRADHVTSAGGRGGRGHEA